MADNKKNKVEMFDDIKAILNANFEEDEIAEYVDFIEYEKELLIKRQAKEKARRAAKKAEPDALYEAVEAVIRDADGFIAADEIVEELIEDFPEVTKGKVTYRAGKLVKDAEDIIKGKVEVGKGRKVVGYGVGVDTDEDEDEADA